MVEEEEEKEEEETKPSKAEMKRMSTDLRGNSDLKRQDDLQSYCYQVYEEENEYHSILYSHSNEAYISYYTPKTKHKQDLKNDVHRSMDTESGYSGRREAMNVPFDISETTSSKKEQSLSLDVFSLLSRYYNNMPMLAKIRFIELFFIIIVSSLCILKGDIFRFIILFFVFTNGLQASFMISHRTYKIIMFITALSLIVKYALQLPVFRICVNYGEEYYLTFLQTCVSEGEINYSIFQPYSLLGVTGMTHDGRVRVSSIPDVVIMVLCIMMRSTLKSYGLWRKSLVRLVIDDVGHF